MQVANGVNDAGTVVDTGYSEGVTWSNGTYSNFSLEEGTRFTVPVRMTDLPRRSLHK